MVRNTPNKPIPIRLVQIVLPTRLIGKSRNHNKQNCSKSWVNKAKTKVDKSILPQLGITLRAGFTAKSVSETTCKKAGC